MDSIKGTLPKTGPMKRGPESKAPWLTNDLVRSIQRRTDPALKLKQLKEFIRQKSKDKPMGSLTSKR